MAFIVSSIVRNDPKQPFTPAIWNRVSPCWFLYALTTRSFLPAVRLPFTLTEAVLSHSFSELWGSVNLRGVPGKRRTVFAKPLAIRLLKSVFILPSLSGSPGVVQQVVPVGSFRWSLSRASRWVDSSQVVG